MEFFERKLSSLSTAITAEASQQLALRQRVQNAWSKLVAPIELDSNAWLVINPSEVALGPLSFSSTELQTVVQIRARPYVTVGKKPDIEPLPLPPPGGFIEDENDFFVHMPTSVQRTAVRKQLRRVLELDGQARWFPATGEKRIRVIDADVFGYGRKIVLWLKFGGTSTGELYFQGTPAFDPSSEMVSFPDLDYHVDTNNALVNDLAWFKREELLDFLRAHTAVNLSSVINDLRTRLTAALNQQHGDVTLRGQVDRLQLASVQGGPGDAALTLHWHAAGALLLSVN